jgi:IS5 family transposase
MTYCGTGKTDKRDWKAQNLALVMFLPTILRMMWIDDEGKALEEMNKGKRGRPYRFSDIMVEWAMTAKAALAIPYRQASGLIMFLLSIARVASIRRSQLCERGKRLSELRTDTKIPVTGVLASGTACAKVRERITVAIDSSGLRLSAAGRWRMKRHNDKDVTGWVKMHVAVDTATNEMLAFVITTEAVGDNSCFRMLTDLLMNGGFDVRKVLADAAYNDKDNWNLMRERGIEFIANLKKNSSRRFRGCSSRGLQVIRRMRIGEHAWKVEVGYGIRWKAECAFSDFKRLFGDMLTSRRPKWMAFEILWRIHAHNIYKGLLESYENGSVAGV